MEHKSFKKHKNTIHYLLQNGIAFACEKGQ